MLLIGIFVRLTLAVTGVDLVASSRGRFASRDAARRSATG